MNDFIKQRNFFRYLKSKCEYSANKKIVGEFLKVVEYLLKEYDTSIYENRFVVGGAVEHIFVAYLRALGFRADHSGGKGKRTDIVVEYEGSQLEFSIKTNFTGKGDIRLINKLGDVGEVFWDEPTIFLISELGLVYSDPDFLGDKVVDKGDAIIVNVSVIKDFSENNQDFVVRLPIPKKYSSVFSTQSFDVAKSVLEKSKSKILIKYL